MDILEATPRVELGIKDLQSSALPLGYVAEKKPPRRRAELSKYAVLEATPRVELGIKDLQSSALPLGYVALYSLPESRKENGDPNGT